MKGVRLVTYEDEPTGNLGLIVKGCEGPEIFADSTGMLLAHDILEHQNGINAIGCVADELEAIGGLWQVRGRHGDLVTYNAWHSIERQVAGDILACAMDASNGDWWPGRTRYRTHRHEYDDEFQAVLEEARPMIRAEHRDDDRPFPLEAFMSDALHLMRMGFNKARRRFGMDYLGIQQFRAIKDALAPVCKHADFAGREFILAYGDGRAQVREVNVW